MKQLDRLTAAGRIEGGKLVLRSPEWFRKTMTLYEDCSVIVLVEKKKTSRSKQQLGYLWGIVYPEISNHTGHTPEDLHDIFKVKFLRRKMVWRGSEVVTVGSTSSLTVGEMAEFITNVILAAEELGIAIPPPDKAYQFK